MLSYCLEHKKKYKKHKSKSFNNKRWLDNDIIKVCYMW